MHSKPEGDTEDDGSDRYIAEIRRILDERACVRSSFSAAHEVLARQWFHAAIPLERIGQAIRWLWPGFLHP
jgi:hypothetical protein